MQTIRAAGGVGAEEKNQEYALRNREKDSRGWIKERPAGRRGTRIHWTLLLLLFSFPAAGFHGAAEEGSPATGSGPQFRVPEGFAVEQVYAPEQSGSVVAMTFDSQGRLVISRERGPVVTLLDRDGDGRVESEKVFTDQVTNCQGIHFDGEVLLAVGDGPQGVGLYRVADTDGDGSGDQVRLLTQATRRMGEHGPHTLRFGPDGYIYWILGNHTGLVPTPGFFSPYQNYYEGHLLPSYTDPRGHANDVRAPGGTIARLDLKSAEREWELVAGGFRNAYDAAFNLLGELFTFDSDMEWDINLPWFRPVRTVHVVPGGEYGWRTGSGKWPEYYLDSLPALTNVGRGSPVGVLFYQHSAYPSRYYDAFFQGDWSRGRILVGFLEKSGASYRERSEAFLQGEPLNITHLEVGPDGWIYFAKGGRFTEGGIFRIVYRSEVPSRPEAASLLDKALTQPQPRSAWGRRSLEEIRQQMGKQWQRQLVREIQSTSSTAERRARALELLQVYGPEPDEALLASLRRDPHWEVRAASTYYLGLHRTESARLELVRRLEDPDPMVRRRACEALIRTGIFPGMKPPFSPVHHLFPLLRDGDRWVRYAARQLLTRTNRNLWRNQALQVGDYPAAPEALLALVQTASGTQDIPYLLERELELLQAEPAGHDLLALLRVLHLTMIQDQGIRYTKIYEPVGEWVLSRFPAADADLNRELARTLAYLNPPGAVKKITRQLQFGGEGREQEIFYAYCLRTMKQGWEPEHREAVLQWFQKTQEEKWKGGASFLGFLQKMWLDFLEILPHSEQEEARQRVASLTPRTIQPGDLPEMAFRRSNYTETLSEQELEEYLLYDPMSYTGDPEKGKLAYEKAFCSSCHRFGDLGQEAGPDLTDVGRRFPRKDLIEAILYPSRTISDLWRAERIETRQGNSVVGVVSRETAGSLTLLTVGGLPVEIPKEEIVSRRPSPVSLMPEGLLNNLELGEIRDLFAFLEQGVREQ